MSGAHYRIYTVGLVRGGAAELAVPLDAVDNTLKHLVVLLALLGLGGVALASVLGLAVARAALVPVNRLTARRRAGGGDDGPLGVDRGPGR